MDLTQPSNVFFQLKVHDEINARRRSEDQIDGKLSSGDTLWTAPGGALPCGAL